MVGVSVTKTRAPPSSPRRRRIALAICCCDRPRSSGDVRRSRPNAVFVALEAPKPGDVTVTRSRVSSPASSSMRANMSATKASMYSKVAPSGARALSEMLSRSSIGASSAGRVVMNSVISPPQTTMMGKASQRCRRNARRLSRYLEDSPVKKGAVHS
jgi:hypothetical protein